MNGRCPSPILIASAMLISVCAGAATLSIGPERSIEVAARALKPGDTLLLEPGLYRQSVTLEGLAGRPKRPITIRARPGAVILPTDRDGVLLLGGGRSEYLVFDGLTVQGATRAGLVVNQARHITIRNCTMASNGVWGIQTILSDNIVVEDCELSGSQEQHGVYFSTTDHPVVRRCRIYDNAGCGVHFNGDVTEGGDGIITGAIVEDNVIYRNGARGGSAVNMDGVERAQVRNNLIFNNASGGITSFKGNGIRAGDDHVITSNTVFIQPNRGRFAVQILGTVTNVTLARNVLVAGRGPVLEVVSESLGGIRSDENLFFMRGTGNVIAIDDARMDLPAWRKRTRQDRRSQAINPGFVDPGATNFTVTADLPPELLPIGYQPRGSRR